MFVAAPKHIKIICQNSPIINWHMHITSNNFDLNKWGSQNICLVLKISHCLRLDDFLNEMFSVLNLKTKTKTIVIILFLGTPWFWSKPRKTNVPFFLVGGTIRYKRCRSWNLDRYGFAERFCLWTLRRKTPEVEKGSRTKWIRLGGNQDGL